MVQKKSARIAAIDWMRGLVMVLMVIDHASMAFNGAHLSTDSVGLYRGQPPLPEWAFLSRWMTHLCAPTFVFLAGTALALSIERRVQRGEDPWVTDRGILTRGAIIALLDPTIISAASGRFTLQVLFAIGTSIMAMAALRRLPIPLLVGASLGWMVAGEAVTDPLWAQEHSWPSPWVAAVVAALFEPALRIAYPVLPWLSMMMLGWAFGRYLVGRLAAGDVNGPARTLFVWGSASLAVFAAVRWLDGYGNMFLYRVDDSWVQWLHVSKYPPSLSFTALELGLLGVILSAMIVLERRVGVRRNGPLLVFGQTAMFYYLAHRLVFEGLATWVDLRGTAGLAESYAITAVSLVVLYPACRWYRDLKSRYPQSWLRYF